MEGVVGRDTTAGGGAIPRTAAATGAASEPTSRLLAGRSVVFDGGDVGAEGSTSRRPGPPGRSLSTRTLACPGDWRRPARVPGERGGDLRIGDAEALARLAAKGIVATRPDRIVISTDIDAGSGGDGYDEAGGTQIGGTIYAAGSDGGRGGDIVLVAREVRLTTFIMAGSGGNGGSCGRAVFEAPAIRRCHHRGGRHRRRCTRHRYVCRTGAGGNGGDVVIDAQVVAGADHALGGYAGEYGNMYVRAGNGGRARRGGNVEAASRRQAPMVRRSARTKGNSIAAVVGFGGNGGDSGRPGRQQAARAAPSDREP